MSPHRDLVTLFGIAEPLSTLTHLVTALTLAACALALVRRGIRPRPPLLIFTAAVVGMLLASATYHALAQAHPARQLFWHLDHASIWIVLAATFSAVRFLYLEGRVVPAVVGLWTIAFSGVAVEMVAMRDMPFWISPALYILMGWCGLPTVLKVWRVHGWPAARPMLLAGFTVTIGGMMDVWQWPHVLPGVVEAHELLHFTTVVAGSVYFYCLWCVAPVVAELPPEPTRVETPHVDAARAA